MRNLMKAALLLIDIQNDFLEGGNLEVPRAKEILPFVKNILPRFKRCIATQDWHPTGHQSFAKEHHQEPFTCGEVDGVLQTLWPIHCVQKTHGANATSVKFVA